MSRNITLTTVAGRLRAQGLGEEAIRDALLASPERNGLPEAECRAIAKSISAKPAGNAVKRPEAGWPSPLHELAARRGWTVQALEALGCRADRDAVAFPLRDASGKETGVRLRKADGSTFGNGAKSWTPKGQRLGLLTPWPIPSDGLVLVVEGEADIAAALSAGHAVTVATPGATPGRRVFAALQHILAGREIILCPDPDPAGNDWRDEISAALLWAGCKVRFVPPLPGLDLDKRLAGEPDKKVALAALIGGAVEWKPSTATNAKTSVTTREITITTDERRVNDEALAALAQRDETIFQRGGQLVTITRETRPGDIDRPTGAATIAPIPLAGLRERLATAAEFVRVGAKGKKFPEHVPGWCAQAIQVRGEWAGIRPLVGIVQAPTIRRDGSILSAEGYDPASGLYLAPVGQFNTVRKKPTLDDIHNAVEALLEVVADFPFLADAHRSAWIAALLTLMARHAFDGPAPLFLIDANTRGSGKTLLADAIGLIATGRNMPRMTAPRDDDEARKRITSLAMAGDSLVLLDNIAGTLGCASLDAALTADTWRDRVLGRSEMTSELPLRAVWFASGNNVVLAGDTSRRTVYIRLQSPEERPEERQGFHHPDLRSWLKDERPRLLAAGLTILRGFFADGCPSQGLTPWGSFEGWSSVVREAIVWAGLPDPAETREALRDAADHDGEALRTLLEGLHRLDPSGRGMTARDILQADSVSEDGLTDVVHELATGRGGKPNARTLGMRLEKLRGRVCAGLALERLPRTEVGTLWRAVPVSNVNNASGGTPLTCEKRNSKSNMGRNACIPRSACSPKGGELVEWTA